MNVVFRVDSSSQIGSGHLMRCLTLAEKLRKEKDARIYFVMRNLEGNLIDIVQEKGFEVFILNRVELDDSLEGYARWLTVSQERDAYEVANIFKEIENIDLLVVDSYAIDIIWESIIRPYVKRIIVIDDLANRKHDCDMLLDQNYYKNKDYRYEGLVPKACKLFLGPQYAILREEFYKARKHLKSRDGNIKNILVFFGGVDLTNETRKTLEAIIKFDKKDITVNVIVGQSNPHKEDIKKICDKYPYMNYYCQVNNIADFMNQADLAIGAGGTTTWERCFLGLPSIVIAVAENQVEIAEDCNEVGYIKYLGFCKDVTTDDISSIIQIMYGIEIVNMNNKILGDFCGTQNNIFERS